MGFIAVGVLIIFKERKSSVVPVVGKEIGVLSETARRRDVSDYVLIVLHSPAISFHKCTVI